MKNIKIIINNIKKIDTPETIGFNVFEFNDVFFGKNELDQIVFLYKSDSKSLSINQKTRNLFLGTNVELFINVNGLKRKDFFNIIICRSNDYKNIYTFIYLITIFIDTKYMTLSSFFESLKSLFSNNERISYNELQGLFGELYLIDNLSEEIPFFAQYWHSIDKMKFDFSITGKNKIEVKTTKKDTRIHKFRHEQLVSDIYDTWIVSIMLREDDQGLSIYELSERVKLKNLDNLEFNFKLINILKNFSYEELNSFKFNEKYLTSNIKFFRTSDIPRFNTEQPIGVTNTEYDSNLSLVKQGSRSLFVRWVRDLIEEKKEL